MGAILFISASIVLGLASLSIAYFGVKYVKKRVSKGFEDMER